ncbi:MULTISPECIES: hypothetical protein [Paracoccus]|jgi:hypothetical protein|uniref:DUF1579 domain-containing protein n=1 Tax=Paracoccus denitrificans (strain Pd 1222) TaxID=318586 RepID=A1B7A5_PARDP|nr:MULTISPECIES: hypothetical protein [Paracoccus]HLV82437.1 hypothetical protein [Devosia sp.]ABL71399.1 hypothetical protein Pden_3323 [Paracoccus denitrificans PD1222]MBB4629498.1 hypothetical protein [Paracoccus denitrificans]MCU7430966.1 hypothetical protein [Paracoccus denitrificans]QAR28018.1 hypothetical protein EO213_16900 [Paracoccus denitrificans]
MRPVIVLTAILSCAAVPALAQRASDISGLCGTSSPATWQGLREHFVGDWRVDHLSGYVHAGRMVIPMEPSPETETMSIWVLGEDLLLDHAEMTEPMAITLADEGRWVIEANHPEIPEPALTPDEAVLAWAGDCDQEDLPRLIGQSHVAMAGAVMDMTLRMLPVDMDTIYAILEIEGAAQGQYVVARRVVWLNRAGE